MSDPFEAFARHAEDHAVAGYFERGDAPGLPGRWAVSFTDPADRFTLKRGDELAELDLATDRRLRGDPRRAVLGYATFDAVSLWEPLLAKSPGGSPFPLGEFAVVDDLRRHRLPPTAPALLRRTGLPPRPVPALDQSLSPREFRAAVRHLHRAIGDGDAFQVVLATRRRFRRPADLLARAALLRARERFAYFYYLKFDDREIVGASPESVVEIDRGRAAIHPIAGTRPVGDARIGRRPLARDPKELAEHRMLVDLARNDLGKVSVPGSVRVAWRERNFQFARLEHLISRVEGRLRPKIGPWTALAATFPAGTVSGAPKIRATQLLRREEKTWRGPYAGAVGLLTGDRRTAWALSIRTAFTARQSLYTCAGAGIVWGSEPAREYREARAKLAHVEAILVGTERP